MILLPGLFRLLLLPALWLLAVSPAYASWWHCDWQYRTEMSLSSSGSSSNDAIRLSLTSAQFDAAYAFTPNGADFRVIAADDATELNYFLEEWDAGSRTAVVNVEVPTLSASSTTIFFYYGNVDNLGNSAVPSTSDAVTTFSVPGWRFHTRNSTLDPTNEAEARAEFESLLDNNLAYGCTALDSVAGHNNRNTFAGSRNDFALYLEAYFEVTTAGVWNFRMGSDYGRGGGLYVNGQPLDARWNTDLWWAMNYNNPDVLSGSIFLEPGFHLIEALGFEGCCDGTVSVQFQSPGSSTWQEMDTTNINLVTRDCPAGVVTPATIESNTPAYFSGVTFQDNGIGGIAHDGLQQASEPGLAGNTVVATVVNTGTVRDATTDANGDWSVCFLDEANNSDIRFDTSPPPNHMAVSEGPAGVNSDAALNSRVVFTAAVDTSYTDINFGYVDAPTLVSAQTVTVGASETASLAHQYTATTSASVSLDLVELEHEAPLSYNYTALVDADCDGVSDTPGVAMPSTFTVEAGEQHCFVIEVEGGVEVFGDSVLRLQVRMQSALQGTAITQTLTLEDRIDGEVPTELSLQKSVCNASRTTCDVLSGAGFSQNNAGSPSEELIYRVTYSSPAARLSDVSVFDQVPAFTTLKPMSVSVVNAPAGVSCNVTQPPDQSSAGYVGAIEWQCQGSVDPSQSGVVAFTVVID